MGRSWAVAQTASVGASAGALVGAPVAYSQERIAGALVAAGFLLGAAIVSQSYALRSCPARFASCVGSAAKVSPCQRGAVWLSCS
jgi:hypothetical protein